MSSTTATLKTNAGQLIPQAYVPASTTYEAVTARAVGSSEHGLQVVVRGFYPFARETITVTSSGQSLSTGIYASAINAMLELSGGTVHYRLDGTAASTSLDHVLDSGDIILLDSTREISNFRAVLGSTATASLVVTYST